MYAASELLRFFHSKTRLKVGQVKVTTVFFKSFYVTSMPRQLRQTVHLVFCGASSSARCEFDAPALLNMFVEMFPSLPNAILEVSSA